MSLENLLRRSPELMTPADTALVIVDVQEKLLSLVGGSARILWNLRRLLEGAEALGVARLATEQYPEKLGSTLGELANRLGKIHAKRAFSCLGCDALAAALEAGPYSKILLAGIETHVCIQQTALDLLALGQRVFVAVDAVGARYDIDHQTALRRLDSAGVTLTTTEAALFELCQTSTASAFKTISKLAKEAPPEV